MKCDAISRVTRAQELFKKIHVYSNDDNDNRNNSSKNTVTVVTMIIILTMIALGVLVQVEGTPMIATMIVALIALIKKLHDRQQK